VPRFAITRDGVRVAYETVGHGPALVLIHGLGDDRSLWQSVVERLAPHFCCTALDLRGHGQTTGGVDFDPFGLQRDLEAVISDAGLRRPILIGHSLGGFVATTYAATFASTVHSVVNVDQPLAFEAFGTAVGPLEASLRRGEVGPVLMSVLAQIGLGPILPQLRARLSETRERLSKDVVLGVWAPFFEADLTPTLRRVDALLERLAAPYLCLLGREIEPAYASWLSQRAPHALLESFGDGHYPHLVAPDRFVDRVRAFVGS
jgi:pimeloyl-ACP methyl ester carboxylesterase